MPDPSATIHNVRRVEAIWTRILGIALVLLGLTLLASPGVPYIRRQRIGDSQYSVKSERFVVIPRATAALIVAAGLATLMLASRKPKP